ncbi:MAG: hypothetical protein H6647_13425 [Anaerolineales bacterium]|nr:hypothetical protein [Anaerolineales bacterium]MCO5245899.1 hypothetical protein [Anaerolineae bacterium]
MTSTSSGADASIATQSLAISAVFTGADNLVVYWLSTLIAFCGVEAFAVAGSKELIVQDINLRMRVTIQAITERQTSEVAAAKWKHLSPRWASCYVEPATSEV